MEAEQRSTKCVHFEEAIRFEDQLFLDASIASLSEKQVEGSLCADGLEDLPDPVVPSEHDQDHNRGRYSLRKSLAWDSAFFTSEGFLDPEEISSMIIRADKPDKNMLCGIQEEVAVSTESISTLGSDNLTLEALEDDLFVDIRASIQRSNWQSSNSNSSTSVKDPKNTNHTVNTTGTTAKKELALQDKSNRPIVKKTSGIQSVRSLKTPPNQIVRKLVPERQVSHGSANSQMNSGTRSTAANASKGINRSASFSMEADKREIARNAHTKPECENPMPVPTRKATLQSKAPSINVARRGLPKPAVPSNAKSPQSLTSSASSDSSSVFSAPQAKSAAVKNPSRSSTKASGPLCPKAPSKVELRNKQPSSTLSNCLASTKTSSNPSPASSISECSSVSSCSASRDNHMSKTLRTSVDTVCVESMKGDQRIHSAGKTVRVKTQDGNRSNSKKPLAQHGVQQTSAKPSGLRMPTPKIGFFDGVKPC